MKHLTEEDLYLLIDNELAPAASRRLQDHIRLCPRCRSAFEEARNESHRLDAVLANPHLTEPPHDLLIRTMGLLKTEIRSHYLEELLSDLRLHFENVPSDLKKRCLDLRRRVSTRLAEAFAVPTPSLPAVFGASEALVLGPFGKVSSPIRFEWRPFGPSETTRYVLSITETGWQQLTSETTVILLPENAQLEHGQEYVWTLRVLENSAESDRISGSFRLFTIDERSFVQAVLRLLGQSRIPGRSSVLLGATYQELGLHMDAIREYMTSYQLSPDSPVAYRIATCYDELELEGLRDEWNRRIKT